MREIRYALRVLSRSPGFALIAVLAIALGIGGSTTMFSAINAILLRPLPLIQNQDRLLAVAQYFTKKPDLDARTSCPDYLEFRKQATTLDGFAAAEMNTMILSGGDKLERFLGANISADCFTFLGVKPILGRNFRADEDQPNAPPVALLGYDVWKAHFAGDAGIVGHVVTLNGEQVTIVGVMPKGWRFPEICDIWIPLHSDAKQHPRGNFFLDAIAKVKPGVSIAQARSELEAIAARLATQYPETNSGVSVQAKPLREEMARNLMDEVVTESFWQVRFFSSLFVTFAGLALFLASLGLYGVMDYNVRQRTQEIGVRMALGAQTADVLRMITAHGLRLIGLGLLLGLGGAYFLAQLLAGALHGISAHDPFSFTVVPLLLLGVGLLACYLPARAAAHLDPVEAIRHE